MSDVNPASTWGKTPEQKATWYAENVDNYDPHTYTGEPTATAPPEETDAAPPQATYTPPESTEPDYVADDRPPEEIPTIESLLVENSNVDYTPLPGDPPPPPVGPAPQQAPPIEPPVGMLSGSVDVTGVTDEMTVEKIDAS